MRLRMYCIFDQAAGAFHEPVFVQTDAVIMRQLKSLPEKKPDHLFVKHAEQFTLFHVGEFDDATGKVEVCTPEALVNLKVLFGQGELKLVKESASA